MLVLIIYDISSDKSRQELANYLKSKGFVRLQRSFFAGRPLPSVQRDIERSLPRFIKSTERDVIHLVPVHAIEVRHMRVYGKALTDISVIERLLVIP
ncbi:MAG: CRISPR-associated endonuclease Cas2 [Desulfurococcaceae archaeon]